MTKVSTTEFIRIPGIYEPIERVVETHTICDQCGSAEISFEANAHLPLAVEQVFSLIFPVSLFAFIALGLAAMMLRIYKYIPIICGIGMIAPIDMLVYSCLLSIVERNNNKNPRCNECGNVHIT